MGAPAVMEIVEKAKLSYTVAQAVEATGISRSTLWEKIGSGELRAKRHGKNTLILKADLIAYLESLPYWTASK